jgi:hypothetical protein
MKFSEQLRRNSLSIISLFVAFSALGYNTWRNEKTEANRNIRMAGFEIILHVAELQKITYLSHFEKAKYQQTPTAGLSKVLLIKDLSNLMSNNIVQKSENLVTVWGENWKKLGSEDEFSVAEIDLALLELRTTVLENMGKLK